MKIEKYMQIYKDKNGNEIGYGFTGDILELKNELENIDTKFKSIKSKVECIASQTDNAIVQYECNEILDLIK